MTKPIRGLAAGPLLLAVVALVVASVSFGLHAGASGVTEGRATTSAGDRGRVANPPERPPTRYRRVAGPVTTLAPAGDTSGDDVGSSTALCPYGMRVVSGGYRTLTGGGETFYNNALKGGVVGWVVGAVNDVATSGTVQAFAYCVRSDSDEVPSTRRAYARRRAAVRRETDALLERYRTVRAAQL
jgi:hypothetical protein